MVTMSTKLLVVLTSQDSGQGLSWLVSQESGPLGILSSAWPSLTYKPLFRPATETKDCNKTESKANKGKEKRCRALTVCDSISDKDFENRFREISSLGDDHVICVVEDESSGKIIATGSVFIEKKFLRNCGKVGHIEDVVVDSNARGMQLGKKVIGFLADHARSMGCYKVILDCSLENRAFYEKCGFKQKEIQMVKYFV
ncbi:hypothetical protein CIPAW_10G009800 [Carya illinoinensis]|uniref:Glucosamine 6-phosphate N-acetyltransferase n=1 Tax=Carya illinoinensis TaxID=32201 RepID=A0A8T1P9T2_CARIL|nr:hypothetical protein CIPAW_10G009800 [Carya illinoinensis]